MRQTKIAQMVTDSTVQQWYASLSFDSQQMLVEAFGRVYDFDADEKCFITPQVDKRYHPVAIIGSGGMGSVSKIHDGNLKIHRALKSMHPKEAGESNVEYIRRFLLFEQERTILSNLHHPGIPMIYETGIDGNEAPAYLMNFIEGTELCDYIKTNADLSLGRRVEWFLKICDILSYAHDENIVHGDLKPENILVNERQGAIFVIDWGLARSIGSPNGRDTHGNSPTISDEIMGTPDYMAPEHLSGHTPGKQADVFSLGLILLYTLTGKMPRNINTNMDNLPSYVSSPLDEKSRILLKGLPVSLGAIVRKAAESNLSTRYAGVQELRDDLQHWVDYGMNMQSRRDFMGRMKVARVRSPSLFYGSLFALTSLVLVGLLFVAKWIIEDRHLANEVDQIISQVDWGNDESRRQAIEQLTYVEKHHGSSSVISSLKNQLRNER